MTAEDGTVAEYQPGNFEGVGEPDSWIVDIPLPETGDIAIEVANALQEGTFDVSKEFAGIPDGVLLPRPRVHRGVDRRAADRGHRAAGSCASPATARR